jgi:phage FluMu protein Com
MSKQSKKRACPHCEKLMTKQGLSQHLKASAPRCPRLREQQAAKRARLSKSVSLDPSPRVEHRACANCGELMIAHIRAKGFKDIQPHTCRQSFIAFSAAAAAGGAVELLPAGADIAAPAPPPPNASTSAAEGTQDAPARLPDSLRQRDKWRTAVGSSCAILTRFCCLVL